MSKRKQRPQIKIKIDCNCGLKHFLILGLGDLQVLERGIIKNQNPQLPIRIQTYAPTGRTFGYGQPEYLPFGIQYKKAVKNTVSQESQP